MIVNLNFKSVRLHSVNFIAKKATMFALELDIMAHFIKKQTCNTFQMLLQKRNIFYSKNILCYTMVSSAILFLPNILKNSR